MTTNHDEVRLLALAKKLSETVGLHIKRRRTRVRLIVSRLRKRIVRPMRDPNQSRADQYFSRRRAQ